MKCKNVPGEFLFATIYFNGGLSVNRQERLKRGREKLESRRRQRKEIRRKIEQYAQDILESGNFRKTEQYIQHGNVSVQRHCLSVAECSLLIEDKLRKLGIHCQEREMVRGALLHDYFLYDWHDKTSHKRLHGFHHPGVALVNASKEYRLSDRERDIIVKHMWPLTMKPPACREAWIVTAADKYCSLKETILCRGDRYES